MHSLSTIASGDQYLTLSRVPNQLKKIESKLQPDVDDTLLVSDMKKVMLTSFHTRFDNNFDMASTALCAAVLDPRNVALVNTWCTHIVVNEVWSQIEEEAIDLEQNTAIEMDSTDSFSEAHVVDPWGPQVRMNRAVINSQLRNYREFCENNRRKFSPNLDVLGWWKERGVRLFIPCVPLSELCCATWGRAILVLYQETTKLHRQ